MLILHFSSIFFIIYLSIFCTGQDVINNDYYQINDIYYEAPRLNIEYTNLTLGMSVPINKTRGSFAYEVYVGSVVATICQADKINRKSYPNLNFSGLINLAIEDYIIQDNVGQYATLNLLKSNLYNKTNQQSISDKNISNLGGFIGILSSGRNRVNGEASAGFSMPLVNPGTLDQLDPVDNFAIYSKIENRTYFTMRDTIIYSNINVLVNLMKAYNWTIAANIYQNNVLGFTAQQAIQLYQSRQSIPIFTCNFIITFEEFSDPDFYIKFCSCMTSIDVLNVVSMWTVPPAAYLIIKRIKQNCSAAKNFVFIVVGESEPLPDEIAYDNESFRSVFVVRPYGQWNFSSFVEDCLENGSEAAKNAVETVLDNFFLQIFNCIRRLNEFFNDLPPCRKLIKDRTTPCVCTGLELDPRNNPISVRHNLYLF